MEIDKMSGTGNVRFSVHGKRQQAQSCLLRAVVSNDMFLRASAFCT